MSAAPSIRTPILAIAGLSLIATLFLFWLIYFRDASGADASAVAYLPYVNASLNGASAVSLIFGLMAIKQKDRATHKRFMTLALVFSALFLISYIVYHAIHGDTPFPGQGGVRPVYFAILISHIGLSVVALPLVLTTFYLSWTEQFARHRKLAKITFPIWLYVSVTGVVIVAMLKHWAA